MEQKKQLDFLNRKLEEYRQKYGDYPKDLSDLVKSELVQPQELPQDPFGGKYYIDPASHQVKSAKPYYVGVYRSKEFR